MPRPKSPCGTYPAYRRHLKHSEPIDAACRRAQQEHDAGRAKTHRTRDVEIPRIAPALSTLQKLEQEREEQREKFAKCAADLVTFTAEGDLYAVDDLMYEMNEIMVEWCFVQSAIHDERGEECPDWLDRVIEANDVITQDS
ncbi:MULTISPECIES: hypothetical protein [Bacteria]|uniref:hypothetical protein n=1 Tax=Bacteria TaxID=2 RepID=UPI003C797914